MMDAAYIKDIIALYKKHGWKLRRVLLSEPLRKDLSTVAADIFADAEVTASELDAAWFSRSSRPDCTAWEIRHLSETPFALLEVIDDNMDAEQSVKLLRDTEIRMIEMTRKKPHTHIETAAIHPKPCIFFLR